MSIVSFQLLFFALTLFILFWILVKSGRKMHIPVLLLGNIVFYGSYGVYGILILVIQLLISYYTANLISTVSEKRKKIVLFVGISSLLLILASHKYAIDSLPEIISFNLPSIFTNFVFPIGLSFYTFQSLVYIIDVLWGKFPPSKNMLYYATFLSFYPTILSGPIPRYDNFEYQLSWPKLSSFEFIESFRLILYGVFKKVVIAGFCSDFVGTVFSGKEYEDSSLLLIGAAIYSIQIYADFSGYSDIAIGLAGLFGIKIPKNFNLPYLACSIPEFWRRWHISLSSILNEYLFTPLTFALRSSGNIGLVVSTLVTFTLCGVWHGDSMNFVLWGFLNGTFFLPSIFSKFKIKRIMPYNIVRVIKIILTFMMVSLLWVLFKNSEIMNAIKIYSQLLDFGTYSLPGLVGVKWILFIMGFLLFDLIMEKKKYFKTIYIFNFRLKLHYIIYYALILSILFTKPGGSDEFIYFKF